MLRKCKVCLKEKNFILNRILKSKRNLKIFVDENNSPWCGKTCPDCRKIRDINYSRKVNRYKAIYEVNYHNQKIARDAENKVAHYLHLIGAKEIELTKSYGPDITYSYFGQKRKCEVKCLLKDPNGDSFFTTPVLKNRLNDDEIAIVFPDNEIWIQPMKYHLERTTKSGRRTFTNEIKEVYGVG